jgi:hypothetical protein
MALRNYKFKIGKMARQTRRNWALLGGNAPLPLIPYQNRVPLYPLITQKT